MLIMYWICFALFVDFAIRAGYLYYDVLRKNHIIKYLANFFGAVVFSGIGNYVVVEVYITHKPINTFITHFFAHSILFFFLILGYYIRVRKEEKKKTQIQNESE